MINYKFKGSSFKIVWKKVLKTPKHLKNFKKRFKETL